nr:MAG TPA: hypothetical protein [Caudoviricetes sp.]
MALTIGSARHDENGKYTGGKNGDQDGSEVATQAYYMHSKGWRLIRAKDPAIAEKIAAAMLEACSNNNIGYDQNDRYLIQSVKKYGSLAKISAKVDTDCCDLVRACVYQATGRDCGDCYTATEAVSLQKLGIFEATVDVTASTVLYNGDILVTKTKGHTVIVVSGNPRKPTAADIKTGWVQSGGSWYYRVSPGTNAHGWKDIKNVDGKTRRYYFNTNGVMLTGWQKISGKWYYFEPSGDLAGAMYVSDSTGAQSILTK